MIKISRSDYFLEGKSHDEECMKSGFESIAIKIDDGYPYWLGSVLSAENFGILYSLDEDGIGLSLNSIENEGLVCAIDESIRDNVKELCGRAWADDGEEQEKDMFSSIYDEFVTIIERCDDMACAFFMCESSDAWEEADEIIPHLRDGIYVFC